MQITCASTRADALGVNGASGDSIVGSRIVKKIDVHVPVLERARFCFQATFGKLLPEIAELFNDRSRFRKPYRPTLYRQYVAYCR